MELLPTDFGPILDRSHFDIDILRDDFLLVRNALKMTGLDVGRYKSASYRHFECAKNLNGSRVRDER